MAVQQLTQPILNPIAAFDATKEQTISFVVIGGAQVVANRLVIQDNQTGVEVYSNIESTLKLEHTIPANTLKNGGYYNAVVYTLDNSNTLSSPSTPVPFYCYTQPLLTITNIPATETIENGTYTFEGSYSQIEGELLNSYQFTLYDSNKEVLSQTPLIYYETDSSLSYTFVGMNNDTSYYIELSGQTLNNTSMSTGLLYFTVRYVQPASFAICDLVNDCKDGYVQISSNIVAIDGHSNPDPPIYIDDKEVDLRDPDSYVEWNSGFRIQDDFTMRAWGRDFNDYQNIITLTNDINTEETPNKIELKWMLGDVVKEQLSYEDIDGELINVSDSVTAPIKNLEIYGNSIQVDKNADVYVEGKSTQEVRAGSSKTATGNPVTITDGELDKPVKLGQIDGLSTQETRILPEEYQQLEYIITDGFQTIDTNYKPNNNTRIITKFQYASATTDNSQYNTLFGIFSSSISDVAYNIRQFDYGYTRASYNTSRDIILDQSLNNSNLHVVDFNKNLLYLDGNLLKTFNEGVFQANTNLFIFNDRKNIESTGKTGGKMKMYYFIIYENNNIVRNFIPCYRKSDNTIGLYDLINNSFYTNSNTAFIKDFSKGNDIQIPSPDFPSEIKSIADDINLFDPTKEWTSGTYRYIELPTQNEEYTMSIYQKEGVTIPSNLFFGFTQNGDISSNQLFKWMITDGKIWFNSLNNIKDDTKLNYISVYPKEYNISDYFNIKLQKGTVATPYSKYGEGTLNIEQSGKNILNVTAKTITAQGITFTVNENKSVTINGTNTGTGTYFFRLADNFVLPAGTYTLSNGNSNVSSYGFLFYDDGNNFPRTNISNATFTANTTINPYIRVDKGITINNQTIYPMIIEGTYTEQTIPEYQPYFNKTYTLPLSEPLRSLPNGVKDTLEADGIHRRVGSIILDGVTNKFTQFGAGYNNRCSVVLGSALSNNNYQIINSYCSHFDYNPNVYLDTNDEVGFVVPKNYFYFRFSSSSNINTLELANNWLVEQYANGEPVILNFPLAEEVIEPYTSDQKEVLNSITTQSGTNIFDAQTNMELKYNYNYEIPSPEVESPIKSEGESWNIFNKDALAKTSGANKTVLDTGVRVTQTIAGQYRYIGIEIGKDELLGKTLNILTNIRPSASNIGYLCLFFGNNTSITKTYISNSALTGTGNKKLLVTISTSFPQDCDRIYLLLYSNQSGTGNVGDFVDYTNLQIYEGTEEKPYRPYGYNAFIENKGKNLINPNQTIYTNAGITVKNNGDGSYTASGTSARALSIKLTDDLFTLKSGLPYTNSIEILDGNMPNGVQIAVKVSNANGTITYNYINLSSNLLSNTVTPNEDKMLEGYELYCNAAGISMNFTFRVQLEQNNKATEWQPYFYNSYTILLNAPLRSLPKGTKDILNNKGITRRVGKIVLNGSENWTGFISSYKNTIRAQTMISDMSNIGGKAGLNIMSSHFLPKNLYGSDIVGIEHIYNHLFIRINKYDLDEISLNGFKAWLAAHPTEVIYELATTQNENYEGQTPSPDTPSPIISVGDVKNLIDVPDFNVDYNQQYYQDTNTKFLLKPNYTYTLSFDFNINKSSTDLYYSLGYGTNVYSADITTTTIYSTQTKGRNEITFTVPADIPDNSYLWVRFARTIILADINVDISNIQLEKGKEDTGYQPTTDYNIYPTVSSKNLFDYDNPLYIRTNNLNYNEISNGYHMSPVSVGENTEFTIGIENCFNEGDIYALSFSQLGEFGYVAMYKTLKGTQERLDIIDLTNNVFTAPSQNYDLELVFSMSSSALSNSLEIWSIQIEANNTQTTYEIHEENSSIITLDTPLNRIGDYADWVGNVSPNLLNPVTGSAIVEENTDYFYNKKSTYTANVTIQYKNADGNVISSEALTNDSTISTPENCVEIHIEGLNEQAIKTNHLQIRKGNSNKSYLPYITEPSLIKVTGKIVLDGSSDENWLASGKVFYSDYFADYTRNNFTPISNYFIGVNSKAGASEMAIDKTIAFGNAVSYNRLYIRYDDMATVDTFKTWLSTHNTEVIYVLEEPKVTPLSSLNSEALKALETYESISNIYTNNKLLGTLDLDYANGKDMKEVQNAYVLLKCWNGNKMPYVIHSNYIDIPESTENIFIWMRRKKNIFDLRIENLTKGD